MFKTSFSEKKLFKKLILGVSRLAESRVSRETLLCELAAWTRDLQVAKTSGQNWQLKQVAKMSSQKFWHLFFKTEHV